MILGRASGTPLSDPNHLSRGIAVSDSDEGADGPVVSLRAAVEIKTALAAQATHPVSRHTASAGLRLSTHTPADPHTGPCARHLDEARPVPWTGPH